MNAKDIVPDLSDRQKKRLLIVSVIIAGLGALAAAVIAAPASWTNYAALLWRSWWGFEAGILIAAYLFSILILPSMLLLFRGSLPGKGGLANALFTIGQMNLGRGALVLNEDGNYSMAPVDVDDGEATVTTATGSYEIANPNNYWTRLGMRPFVVTYAKAADAFGEFEATISDAGSRIKADGGEYRVFSEPRGDKWEFSPFADQPADKFVIDKPRLIKTLHDFGAGGIDAAEDAEIHALKEHGGNSQIAQWMFISAVFGALLLGALMGYVVMVGF